MKSYSVVAAEYAMEGESVQSIVWMDHSWHLLPPKALFWPARSTLIVADVHIGKAASFRSLGVPVPRGNTAHDLARLDTLLLDTGCEHLIFLGDLLHARSGRDQLTLDRVARWRRSHSALHITLVRGNHDHSAGDPPDDWRITCVNEPLVIDGLAWRHAPMDGASPRDDRPTIAGHVHPCVRLRDADGSTLRAACFVVSPRSLLLPAFGSFTGGHIVTPRADDRVFVVGDGQVLEATGLCAGA